MKVDKGLFLAIPIAAIALYGATSPRFLPGEKIAVAILPIVALVLALSGRPASSKTLIIGSIFLLFGAFGLLFQEVIYPVWIVGSVVTVMGLFVFPYAAQRGVTFVEGRNMQFVLGALLVSALIAPLAQDNLDFGRFEPPGFLLFSYLVSRLLYSESPRNKIYLTLSILLMLYLSYLSQWRIVLFLELSLLVIIILICWPIRFMYPAILFAALFVMSNQFSMSEIDFDLPVSARYKKLASVDGLTAEMGIRFLEFQDTFDQINDNESFFTFVFGSGHGSTFYAERTQSGLGAGLAGWQDRVTDEGFAFTVHFGPARIFFRYGLIGLLLWIWFFISTGKAFFSILWLKKNLNAEAHLLRLAGAMACQLYLLRSFFQPVEHELVFWVSIAIFIHYRSAAGDPKISTHRNSLSLRYDGYPLKKPPAG